MSYLRREKVSYLRREKVSEKREVEARKSNHKTAPLIRVAVIRTRTRVIAMHMERMGQLEVGQDDGD